MDRERLMTWLKADEGTGCRALSNVRCLSEGVDCPALDSVIFMGTKSSLVDVVQSVGRVMRKARARGTAISSSPSLFQRSQRTGDGPEQQ